MKIQDKFMVHLAQIYGLHLPCSDASPPFYWQMKKNQYH